MPSKRSLRTTHFKKALILKICIEFLHAHADSEEEWESLLTFCFRDLSGRTSTRLLLTLPAAPMNHGVMVSVPRCCWYELRAPTTIAHHYTHPNTSQHIIVQHYQFRHRPSPTRRQLVLVDYVVEPLIITIIISQLYCRGWWWRRTEIRNNNCISSNNTMSQVIEPIISIDGDGSSILSIKKMASNYSNYSTTTDMDMNLDKPSSSPSSSGYTNTAPASEEQEQHSGGVPLTVTPDRKSSTSSTAISPTPSSASASTTPSQHSPSPSHSRHPTAMTTNNINTKNDSKCLEETNTNNSSRKHHNRNNFNSSNPFILLCKYKYF